MTTESTWCPGPDPRTERKTLEKVLVKSESNVSSVNTNSPMLVSVLEKLTAVMSIMRQLKLVERHTITAIFATFS